MSAQQRSSTRFLSEYVDIGDHDVNLMPEMSTRLHQRSLPCYGRGKRLCDIQVPAMPNSLALAEKSKVSKAPKSVEARSRVGRGRGKTRRPLAQDGSESCDVATIPCGVVDYNSSLTESCSLKSVSTTSSRDSQDNKLCENVSQNVMDNSRLQGPLDNIDKKSSEIEAHFPTQSDPEPSYTSTVTTTPPKTGSVSNQKEDELSPGALEGWSVQPPYVCQFNNVPKDFDFDIVKDLLTSYGTIVDMEEREICDNLCMRIKFTSAQVCEEIEANMDYADFAGTGSLIRCKNLTN